MLDNSQKIKEYFNLNGFYLRLHLTNQQLSLISYNSNLLNGVKYEKRFTLDEIKKDDKIKNLTIPGLFDLINKKIKENRIMLANAQNNIALILIENVSYNQNTDIQINLIRNDNYYASEYESVLSNVIMNLREENKTMRNELNEIKNLLKNVNKNNIMPNNNAQFAEVKALNNQISNINQNKNILKNKLSPNIPNQLSNTMVGRSSFPIRNALSGPIPVQPNKQAGINQPQINVLINNNKNIEKNTANLSLKDCFNVKYPDYPQVELSQNSFGRIIAYAFNTYHGIFKNINEDKAKIILEHKPNKVIKNGNGDIINPKISYFGIYDGHGGNKCSDFLSQKFDSFLLNSNFLPLYPLQAINEAFVKSEKEFESISFDSQKKLMLDKSGSCVLALLIIDDNCYISYLGDSRGLYSFDSGTQLFQITRDHKPNDPTEKARIEKAGGKIYKDTRLKINGQKVNVNEAIPGLNFPFRVSPGNLSVRLILYINYYIFYIFQVARTIGDLGSKNPLFGGNIGTVISKPCVNKFPLNDKSDFIILGCKFYIINIIYLYLILGDGIFDKLYDDEILHKIWSFKKKGEVYNDIRDVCGKITDGLIKLSMQKQSIDNLSVIFIAFKNFENKMKDPNFEYQANARTKYLKEQYDFNQQI